MSRAHPLIYEVNTRLRLPPRGVTAERSSAESFGVREDEIAEWARAGFDYVWMMGAWEVGERVRDLAIEHGRRHGVYEDALPGWTPDEVDGSPYAIRSYVPDARLGGAQALRSLRARLREHGLGLLLDFIPNHVGLDHPWTAEHPDRFIRLEREVDDAGHAIGFGVPRGDGFLAHGRDPYFPPWTDTVQLDYGRPETRGAMMAELETIADLCDGVRCDMAMLVLSEVRRRTWGDLAGVHDGRAEREFWPEAIERIRARQPDFLFLAEVYWGLEGTLQEMGFDFTYDKSFYDSLLAGDLTALDDALTAEPERLRRGLRFLENHDEQRAAAAFPAGRHPAAATVTYTLPGARLFHEGQLEGSTRHVPVQLRRAAHQEPDEELRTFYERLLAALRTPAFEQGTFHRDLPDLTCGERRLVLVHRWEAKSGERAVVVVNGSDTGVQARVPSVHARSTVLAEDVLTGHRFNWHRGENAGVHEVTLGPHEARILQPAKENGGLIV